MPETGDFFHLNELFLNSGAINSPSQLQGMLCGKLCGGATMSPEQWLAEAQEFMDIEHVTLDEGQKSLIESLYDQTQLLLQDVNFSFSPLLPEDGASITRRAQELGSWCEGFLLGIGVSGIGGEKKLSADVAEALRDLAQISQVDTSEVEDGDESEAFWVELVEYVKVAVLAVYTELGASEDKAEALGAEGPTLH